MSAPSLLMGSAVFTRHDAHTRKIIADFTARLKDWTDADVKALDYALDGNRHPLAPRFRAIVAAEIVRRALSLAELAGGAK